MKVICDTQYFGDQEWSPSRCATRDMGGRAFLRAALRYATNAGEIRTPEGPCPHGPEAARKSGASSGPSGDGPSGLTSHPVHHERRQDKEAALLLHLRPLRRPRAEIVQRPRKIVVILSRKGHGDATGANELGDAMWLKVREER